jgi:ionotropic glutamate receptor
MNANANADARSQAIAIYTDDDFGTNGASSLGDALEALGSRIVGKAALVPGSDASAIGSVLAGLAASQARVFVVHLPRSLALALFAEAKYLGMMSTGYVWIASDSALEMLLDIGTVDTIDSSLQGIVGTRAFYLPDSPQARALLARWKGPIAPHVYGLYAYDAVWMLAHALRCSADGGASLAFGGAVIAHGPGNTSDLAQLRALDGGSSLRDCILQTDFIGASGEVRVSPKGDLVRREFELVNVVGNRANVVGYWTNDTGLSLSPPEGADGANRDRGIGDASSSDPRSIAASMRIVWPGNSTATPRGWALPRNGRQLRIAVPRKAGFKQFVSKSSNSTGFNGFCIDVFQHSLKYLPYFVPYDFVFFGPEDGTTPDYGTMIDALAAKVGSLLLLYMCSTQQVSLSLSLTLDPSIFFAALPMFSLLCCCCCFALLPLFLFVDSSV